MTERQTAHRKRLTDRFVDRFSLKFLKGTIENDGDLQDIGTLALIKNSQEEVLDQWSYIGSVEEDIYAILELVHQLEDSPIKNKLLSILKGKNE